MSTEAPKETSTEMSILPTKSSLDIQEDGKDIETYYVHTDAISLLMGKTTEELGMILADDAATKVGFNVGISGQLVYGITSNGYRHYRDFIWGENLRYLRILTPIDDIVDLYSQNLLFLELKLKYDLALKLIENISGQIESRKLPKLSWLVIHLTDIPEKTLSAPENIRNLVYDDPSTPPIKVDEIVRNNREVKFEVYRTTTLVNVLLGSITI